MTIGEHKGDPPGARARAFMRLRETLEDARLYRANRGPFIARKLRELSVSAADLEVVERALERDLKVVISVDRATDIRTVLRLVREHRLDAVLVGVREGWKLADEIARARIPVLVNPLDNLPDSFNTLYSRPDNAALLHAAGVRVAFTMRGASHFAARLRQAAGNAIRHGFPYEAAIAAVTSLPPAIFGIEDAGRLRAGNLANLVIWNGDPFEVTSWPTHLFIRGQPVALRSRQSDLVDRYR